MMADTRRPYIRPGFVMTHVANPIMRRLGIVPILAVRGRRSGKLQTVPLGKPLELGGARYLVSGRGNTHWVRNLRAAGRGELRFHGGTEVFRAYEVTGPQREEVVRAYRKARGRSVAGYFERIPKPDEHPVFRMERIDATE
jgi:deazaflavin-dependent oxidoreductase (nitroreductase family)